MRVVVVLPTPPLRLMTAIERQPATGVLARAVGRRGRVGRRALASGGRSRVVATAQRDQGLVGTPGPGGPLLLAHNDPRSVSRTRAARTAYLGGSVHVRLPTDYTDVQ